MLEEAETTILFKCDVLLPDGTLTKSKQAKEIKLRSCYNDIYKGSQTPHRHEVILGPVRPYFDYEKIADDAIKPDDERRSTKFALRTRLMNLFNITSPSQIHVYDSSGPYGEGKYKISFHFHIANNRYFESGLHLKAQIDRVVPAFFQETGFDTCVYKAAGKQQLLRIAGCSKIDSPHRALRYCDPKSFEPTVPSYDVWRNSLVTAFDPAKLDIYEVSLVRDRVSQPKPQQQPTVRCRYSVEEIRDLTRILGWENGQDWSWDYWSHLIWLLRNEADMNGIDLLPLAHEISAACTSKPCNPGDVDAQYEVSANREGDKLAIGTLIMLARQVDPEAVKAWFVKYGKAPVEEQEDDDAGEQKAFRSLLSSPFTDADFSKCFRRLNDSFIIYRGCLYEFTGHYWKAHESYTALENAVMAMYRPLQKHLLHHLDTSDKASRESYEKCSKQLMRLCNSASLNSIVAMVKKKITAVTAKNEPEIWDNDKYLLGFNNGVYDLRTGTFGPGHREQYISRICPYDYEEEDPTETAWLMGFINRVMPIEEERDYLLKCLSTGLCKQLLENVIFLVGNGRNGKDTIMNIIRRVLGNDLSYKAPASLITCTKIREGPNPEIANMHKKNLIIVDEPSSMLQLNCAAIKQVTGCETINARGIYSDVTTTTLSSTLFVLLNSLLPIDKPDDAIKERIDVIRFRSQFLTTESLAALPPDTEHVYPVDTYYKSDEFQNRATLPMLHLLLKYFSIFQEEGCCLTNKPMSVVEDSKQYMSDGDLFVCWFHEVYERTDDSNDYVQLKHIYDAFKQSDLWENMTKAERRKMTKSKMVESISRNPTLKLYFREMMKIRGEDNKVIRSVLRNYRQIS